uniref:Biogenic amine-like GPCR n=1 Tax=Tripedalia cystophora TaxID=6141 RepID=A0A4D5XW78_TRICY|nr:biogenic amine-like GPCR [Tripedalia cystophora]
MDGSTVIELVIILLLLSAILLGNLTMCICIYRTRRLHNPAGYIVASLAVADLLVGVWLLPFSIPAVIVRQWNPGHAICDMNGFTNHVLCTSSMLNLLAVSLDRYVAIIYPLRYTEYMTVRRSLHLITAAWFYGFLTATFPLMGWARYVFLSGTWLCVTDFKVSYSFSYFIIGTVFVIPLTIMSIVYYKIFRIAYKHMKMIRQQARTSYDVNAEVKCTVMNAWTECVVTATDRRNEENTVCESTNFGQRIQIIEPHLANLKRGSRFSKNPIAMRQRREERRKKRTLKRELRTGFVLFIIVSIFVVSWSPFAILNLYALHTKFKPSPTAEAIASRLAYLNSAVNPPLYCLMNKVIRNAVRELWLSFFQICGLANRNNCKVAADFDESESRTANSKNIKYFEHRWRH